MNQQLIEQYVAGKLNEAESDAFEDSLVANPELARHVELEQRLKAGLAQVARGSTSEFVRSDDSSFRWSLALAASVLAFVFAAAYLWQRMPGTQPHILVALAGDAPVNGATMRLALVRGAQDMPELPRGEVRVEIVGLFDPGFHYSVVLDRLRPGKDAVTVAALYGQHPSSPVTLQVMLDSEQLASGAYSLRVVKQASHEEPLDFGFVKP